jgi:hypothetical protein
MNVSSSITDIQSAIDSSNSSITRDDLLLLTVAVTNSTKDRIISVPTIDDLPDAANVANGFMAFVEDIKLPLYAKKNDGWYGIDGRKARNDVLESVSGVLWSWGANSFGDLPLNDFDRRSSPVTTNAGNILWCYIENGRAIKVDGTLWGWGYNVLGQIGDGTTINRSSPVSVIGGGTNWCQVTTSRRPENSQSFAIKTDGTLWSWGCNLCGRLIDGTAINRSSPGTTIGDGTNWCQVKTAENSSGALKNDGTLWTWAANPTGQLGDNTTTERSSPGTTAGGGTNWCHLNVSGSAMAAIKTDGTLWTWGNNACGQLGNGTTTNRSSPGTTAGGGTDWCYVYIANVCAMAAIKNDGTLWTWGGNNVSGFLPIGILGDGTTTNRCSPVTTAGGGTNWCKVVSGNGLGQFFALKTDGTLWTWGEESFFCMGLLGSNSIESRSSPGTTAGGGTNWVDISAWNNVAAGLRSI